MAGKILAAALLLFGGGVTLYVIYKAALGLLQPVVQKKLSQQMQKERSEHLENNLKLQEQQNQTEVKETRQDLK